MNEMLKLLLSLSLSGSILILILFLCRPFFQKRMSKSWQYYIWLIIVARLLLPFAPENNLVGFLVKTYDSVAAQQEINMSSGADTIPSGFKDDFSDANKTEDHGTPLMQIIKGAFGVLKENGVMIWLIVALILLVRKITIYQSFIKYIKAGRSPVDDINLLEQLGNVAGQEKINVAVHLYTNSLISSPLLIGFFHPCIVLPGTDCPDLDLQYIIKHEIRHYKRKDMFYKWLMQITVCLHWFNPFVYLMVHEVNRLCELSCDESVIRHLDEKARRDYGNTLLNAIRTRGNYKNSLASVTLNESKELLRERLDAIMNFRTQSRTIKAVSFILTLFICLCGVFTGAYAAASGQPQGNSIEQDAGMGEAKDIVINLASNGQNGITKSGSFEASDNQILTLTIQSDIEGGSVDLFLFSPDYQEQRITIRGADETRAIALSTGQWAYNCTGFFESGSITIIGSVPAEYDKTDRSGDTVVEAEEDEATVLDLTSGGQDSITQSGSFQAKDNQVLTLTIQSDIRGGSVDLFLFSPDSQEQRITIGGADETRTIPLSSGVWAYNCTGFFKSGEITIIGTKNNE